jgi:hypothetical protein
VRYSKDSNDVGIEAEDSKLLKAIARKRLVKALQAREDLVFATMNCKVWRLAVITCSCEWCVSKSSHQSKLRL